MAVANSSMCYINQTSHINIYLSSIQCLIYFPVLPHPTDDPDTLRPPVHSGTCFGAPPYTNFSRQASIAMHPFGHLFPPSLIIDRIQAPIFPRSIVDHAGSETNFWMSDRQFQLLKRIPNHSTANRRSSLALLSIFKAPRNGQSYNLKPLLALHACFRASQVCMRLCTFNLRRPMLYCRDYATHRM